MVKNTVAIVTGCNGFKGRHLVSFLRKKRKSFKIIGLDLHRSSGPDVDLYVKSRNEEDFTSGIYMELERAKRIFCFHLAGRIFGNDENRLFTDNMSISNRVFHSLLTYREKTVVVNIGSSAEYGYQGKRWITERSGTSPVSGYGRSKLSQTRLAEQYFLKYRLPVIMTRTFNVIGPGQNDKLVCGRFIKQALELEKKNGKKMLVKNLDTFRDFLDVRDAVRAYVLLAEQGVAGQIYNVASGQAIKIKSVLKAVLERVGVSPEIISDVQDSAQDVPYQKGKIDKIRKETGWIPAYTFEDSIRDMILFEKAQ